jgi:tetratricopeptide (TPR) repeat protein
MRPIILLLLTTALARAAVSPAQSENIRHLLHDKQVPAAESAAKALVAANPAEAEAYALLGDVQVAKGDADAAVRSWEKATELAPASSNYQRQLGDAYGFAAQQAGMFGMMGLAKKCRRAYEQAVALDPRNIAARQSLLGYYQMAPGIMGGGMDKAYEQAAAISGLDAARGRRAYALLHAADKQYDLAFAEFDEVLRASPDDYAALYQLGKMAAVSGQFLDRGLAALRRCLELPVPAGADAPEHAAAHWRIGNILEKKNDPTGARAAYQAALQLDAKFTQAADALKKLSP